MALSWPDDYYLPAIAISDWTPGIDPRFYHMKFRQIEGIRKMYNERAVACGHSEMAAYTTPLLRAASDINTLRTNVEGVLTHYLDHVNAYPDGDIEGSTDATLTHWTKANILAAAGVGVGGDWTKVPARDGGPTGGALVGGGTLKCYREHINELYSVLQLLQYVDIGCTNASMYFKFASGFGADCDAAKNNTLSDWQSESWAVYALNAYITAYSGNRYSGTPGPNEYEGAADNLRGKLSYDLTRFSSLGSTIKIYLWLTGHENASRFYSTGGGPPYAPHNQAKETWGLWADADPVIGTAGQTKVVTGSDQFFPWQDSCPVGGDPDYYGWFLDNGNSVIIAQPAFDYP